MTSDSSQTFEMIISNIFKTLLNFYDESDLFLKDIHREIRKIADFIDVALTDDEIEQIAQNTSFQRMKTESTDASGKPTFSTTLFRKGKKDVLISFVKISFLSKQNGFSRKKKLNFCRSSGRLEEPFDSCRIRID